MRSASAYACSARWTRAASEMTDKRNGLDRINAELKQADADLERQRAALNVNDPQSVAQFRQRLEQRDALFKRSTGPVVGDASAAVQRYNDRVGADNQQCANRPLTGLQAQIQVDAELPGGVRSTSASRRTPQAPYSVSGATTGAAISCHSPSRQARKKQLRRPVWQATPA